MKKIVLVARKDIIDPRTLIVHDDKGLFALDGIRYGQVKTVFDEFDQGKVMANLIEEFEQDDPNFHADRYELLMHADGGNN